MGWVGAIPFPEMKALFDVNGIRGDRAEFMSRCITELDLRFLKELSDTQVAKKKEEQGAKARVRKR